ncbi:bacteriophage abortive infection AbiH family protein [Pseudobutyrivibrio xylanivorans]|uniref:Bacteriophage abortive infection AbiH n=1 Tax=Pseudobutyrivibrio xylanivorans TaxID=185007 RepID=A0A5P6VTQ2_PSEXY|nr:bacteriophage abortive infection AbiH family protein [Pseudobutyrivibrio xylanivorans]QFJ56016.1 hypothetical protein FXF36_14515 [Pseudobutyrivibrio xylanivorans]
MKTLFIIGNGFDCYGHQLKTKYTDFRRYIINNYPDYNYDYDGLIESTLMPDGDNGYDMDALVGSIISLMDNCAKPDWSELEASAGTIYASSILDRNEQYFHDVDWNDDDKAIRDAIYNNEDISNDITNGFIQLKQLFEEWAFEDLSKIDFSNVKKIRKPSFKDAVFLNFNYTSTLEDLYDIPVKNICHIHGFAKDNQSYILFGHGEEESIHVPADYFGANEAFDSLVHYMRKDTYGAIKRNQKFFNSLTKINKIYSYGFSFSDVDMCYIEEISTRINPQKVRWYFNSHDWKNNKDNIEKIKAYGYKVRKCGRW